MDLYFASVEKLGKSGTCFMRACAQIKAGVVLLQLASLKIPFIEKDGRKSNLNKTTHTRKCSGLNEKDSFEWKRSFQQHLIKLRT